jgi:hypothetical protein
MSQSKASPPFYLCGGLFGGDILSFGLAQLLSPFAFFVSVSPESLSSFLLTLRPSSSLFSWPFGVQCFLLSVVTIQRTRVLYNTIKSITSFLPVLWGLLGGGFEAGIRSLVIPVDLSTLTAHPRTNLP